MELYGGALEAYYVLAAINLALWLLSTFLLGKTWPVDFIWSSWPIAHALAITLLSDDAAEPGGWQPSQLA